MRTLTLLAILTFATPALATFDRAAGAPLNDDKAQDRHHAKGEGDENSCFGQGRAAVGSTTHVNGYKISQRKGDNPENNEEWIAMHCDTDESDY